MRQFVIAPDITLVAAVVLGALSLWARADGGYTEVVWYPVAIVLLLLTLVLGWAAPARRLGRFSFITVSAFAAFTAWSFLSIIWAKDRGIALTGANRTLVYLIVLLLVFGRRWRGPASAALLALWAFVVVAIGTVELALAAYGGHPANAFTWGRLSTPIDYANANAALFALAAWALLLLAQARAAHPAVRALALAAAGAGVELVLLAQSKGAALATAGTLAVLLLVLRRRVRFAVPVLLVGLVVTLFSRPLLNVYTRLNDGDRVAAAIRGGATAVLASFALLALLGAVMVIAERRLTRSPRWERRLTRAAAILGVVTIAAAVSVGLVLGHPLAAAQRTWHAFKYPPSSSGASSHFVTGAGNHRYDFWRVAARQFGSSPILGAGVDNFEADYVRERRSSEQPLYPHSLEARLLGGTGIVGAALFAVFAIAAVCLCLRAARSESEHALTGSMAVAMLVYWLGHGSVDWLWEFPALSGPVFAAVGCTGGFEPSESRRAWSRSGSLGLRLGLAVGASVALVALVPAWLAARDVSLAVSDWRSDPAAAYSRLSQAARLNRLSDEPYVVAGSIAERRRQWTAAAAYFARAVSRNNSNWYSQLELGIAADKTGSRQLALARLRRAAQLDPREQLVADVLRATVARRIFSVATLDHLMVDRTTVRAAR